jgi:SAM-dependent methyltransferase
LKSSLFSEIHNGLPREGPGDNASTRKAFSMLTELPANPRILDVACGPGMQTIEIAQLTNGAITALDIRQPFLDELERRARKVATSARIKTIKASMFAMPFERASFDLIWSEGAIYIIGFQAGLAQWKPLLTTHGYMAVTEPCWLKPDVPDEVRRNWADDYPTMATIEDCLRIVKTCGYRVIGHFMLPKSAWWDDYYSPLESRLMILREKYKDDSSALEEIELSQAEIEIYRKYSDCYGYVFFMMQNCEN